ncbi:MAG TPA: isoprenylcysteine carboxylmethyltransferase family protein [Acidobacteriota bacterium]
MQFSKPALYITLHSILVVGWIGFFAAFIRARGKRVSDEKNKRQSGRSRLGIVLQGVAFFLAWSIQHWPSDNLLKLPDARWNYPLALVAGALLAGSIWLAASAVRTLGKQWSLTARLLEGHELVMSGPYRRVRHPIYTALLGMLIATLLIHSHWFALPVTISIFLFGTWIRVSEEDRLLAQQFGAVFDAYRDQVPALLPRLW